MANSPVGIMTTSGYTQARSLDFAKIVFDQFRQESSEWTEFLPSNDDTRPFIKVGQMVGFGSMQALDEGAAISYDSLIEGNSKIVYYSEWGLGAQITKAMKEDDQTGYFNQIARELARSYNYSLELEGANILNTGFTGGTIGANAATGLDGVVLYSASHTAFAAGGSTQSNLVSAAFSYTMVQATYDLFESLKNDRGVPTPIHGPYTWVIPYALRWKALELDMSEYNPNNANNAVNTIADQVKFSVNHYLTSSTAAFCFAPGKTDLHRTFRRKGTPESGSDFKTGSELHKITARWVDYWGDWRGTVATSGS